MTAPPFERGLHERPHVTHYLAIDPFDRSREASGTLNVHQASNNPVASSAPSSGFLTRWLGPRAARGEGDCDRERMWSRSGARDAPALRQCRPVLD